MNAVPRIKTLQKLEDFSLTLAFFLLLLPILNASPVLAQGGQAKIEMRVDKKELSMGDELYLSISISGISDIRGPSLENFRVLSRSSSTTIINGARSVTNSFTLLPEKEGSLSIGKIEGFVQGKKVAEAAAISITVKKSKPLEAISGEEAQSLQAYAGQSAFIRWATARASYYENEAFPIALELWVQNGLSPRQPEVIEITSFNGFLTEDIPVANERAERQEQLQGKTFQVYVLTEKLATPLKTGTLLIDPTKLQLPLSDGGFMSSVRRVALQTAPIELDIKPLPQKGQPKGFKKGSIGQFSITSKVSGEKGQALKRIQTGERFMFSVSISGRGNLDGLKAPEIESNEIFDFSPIDTQGDKNIHLTPDGKSGTRNFEWLVLAKSPGNHSLPSFEWPYFDPRTGRYESPKVGGQSLEVTGSNLNVINESSLNAAEDVGPIIEEASLTKGGGSHFPGSVSFWALTASPLLGYLLLIFILRRREEALMNPSEKNSKRALQRALSRLKSANVAMKEELVKDFYGQLSRTLTGFLEDHASIPATGLTYQEVRAKALEMGYTEALMDRWLVEQENCDFARFSSSQANLQAMKETQERIEKLIRSLNQCKLERGS